MKSFTSGTLVSLLGVSSMLHVNPFHKLQKILIVPPWPMDSHDSPDYGQIVQATSFT